MNDNIRILEGMKINLDIEKEASEEAIMRIYHEEGRLGACLLAVNDFHVVLF